MTDEEEKTLSLRVAKAIPSDVAAEFRTDGRATAGYEETMVV